MTYASGEWVWDARQGEVTTVYRASNGVVPIAKIATGFAQKFELEQRSNIRLIVAAPQLLQALQDCVFVMQRDLKGLALIQSELMRAVLAISVATEREPTTIGATEQCQSSAA